MSNSNNEFVIKLLALLDEQKSKTQINTNIKDLEKVVRKLKLTATLAKGTTKTELNQTIKQIESQLRQIKIQAKIDNRQLNREINNALRNVSARDINLNINSNGERLTAQVRRAVSQAREFVERNPISVNIDLKREKLLNQLTAFTNKHTKINESSYWLGEAERLRTVISSVTNRDELRNATDQLQVFTTGVRATGYAAVSTTDRIKGMLGSIIKVGNYFGLAFVAVNKFRQSLSTLKTNDTILTEISKTSEMTKQQLKELGNEAFKVASKYGQVSGNYLLAVQEMARSGYETLSRELGELSLLAQSAGDMTADSANNYLLATDAAYKYSGSVEKLNAALDGANYISNKNSASLTDIADATRVSASFAANAGVAIDELTAAEATMIAVTKRSGSEIGRAFRSIVLNLQQVSGEFDGEVIDEEQLKKVEDRCHSLGVELEYMKDGVPTLRNTMDVLRELAEVYNSLPDNSAEKQGLIADIGGKYHANSLSALLSRWDMYEKMLGEFSQGTGSALEEANKTADSWEGRLAQLQNSWDSFVNTLTNKTAVKGGVSFLDNTIQAFEKLTETVGALPVLLTTINASMSALNKNYGITQIYNKSTHKIDLQGSFMGIDITAYKTQANHFREAAAAMETWNAELVNGTADINTFGGAVVQNNEQLRAYLQTTSVDAPASLNGYRSYLNAAGQSTDALRLKTVLMTSAMSIGFSFALQAVFQLIQAGVTVIDDWIHRVEKANEAMDEAITEYDSVKSSLESVNTELEDQNKKMDELLAKDKLTYAEKGQLEELQAITRELLLQQDIEQRRADKASKDVAEKTVDAYEKQYGKYDVSREKLNETLDYINSTGISAIADSENDIVGNIAAYLNVTEGLKKAQQEYETALNNGENTEFLIEDVQDYIDAIDDYSDVLDQNISDLQEKRLALEDEYNKAVAKRENGQDLTSYETDAISTYESVYDAIKLIYEYTNKNDWNNMEISNIFNTEGIEKTKEELISMYKSGELASAEMLEQFPKLNQAIRESEIIAGEGSDAFKEFFNEIAALADQTEDTVNGVANKANLFDQLTTSKDALDKFQSSVKSAADAYSTLMSGNYSSSDMLDSIQAINEAVTEMGGSLDWEFIDTQTQLNSLDLLGGAIEHISQKYAESVLSGAGIDVDSKFGQMLANNIIQAQKASTELEVLDDQIDSLQSAYSDLTDIVDTYNETGYITFDQLQTLLEMEPQYLSCLIDENGQLQLNEAAMAELANQRLNDAEAQAIQQAITELGQLALQDEKKAVQENAEAFTNAVDDLSGYNAELANTIAEATVGAAAIRDLNAAISGAESQGATDIQINTVLDNLNTKLQMIGSVRDKVAAGGLGSVIKPESASKSGKKAADAYLEAFEKELEKLQGMRDRNEITEKEYLDNLRALYEKYFKDREKYIDEFEKYEQEYLEGMESLYKDVMNGIIKLVDKQADKYEEMKDSAVDSYNAQKDAAEDAYDAQIEGIESQIDGINDMIDAINDQIDAIDDEIEAKKKQADAIQDEIDKIKEAREERQKQLDLQKAQYEFQRMMNQRTILQYSEEKGMHYVADTSGTRDKKEEIDEIKEEIYISGLEKQIKLINDEIDLLEERKDAFEDQIDGFEDQIDELEKQKDAIEKMKDASNDYFESMIKQTETYYDKLIESLDKTKSRWEELADLKEEAEMKGKMEEILSQYGVTADDVVNMSEETFQAFKNDYLAMLSDLYSGNEQMQSAIAETAGTTTDQLESYIAKTQEYIDTLISMDMSDTAASMDDAVQSMDSLSTATSDANKNTKAMSENMGTLSTNTAELGENAAAVSDALSSIPDAEKFNAITTSFTNLAEAVRSVADALGVSGNSTVSSLVDTLQSLSTISIDGDGNGLISQFNNLKTAIEGVTSAISGGGMSGGSGSEGAPSSSPSMSAGAGGKSSAVGGLISAVEGIKTATDEALGTGGGEDGEGGGTGAIGQFEQLKDAVDDVTASIGGGSSESGQGSGRSESENADSLIGSIVELGDTTEEILTGGGESEGESGGVIGRFEEFSDVIEEAKDHVTGISEGLDEIDGKEVECTIRVNIETNGSLPAFAEGTLGDMNLESGEYTAKYGKAFAEGTGKYKGLPKAEKNALVSEYGQTEMTVLPDGKTIITDEPTMMDLPKDTVIYNEEQTKKIMDNKIDVSGNAHADGTDDSIWTTLEDGTKIRPLQPGDRMYDMLQKFNAYFDSIDRNVEKLVPNSFYDHQKQMEQMANQITNYNNVVNNNKNVQPVVNNNEIHVTLPNVTNSTSADELLRDLQSINTKKFQMFG